MKDHPEVSSWDIYKWTNLANRNDHAHRITFAYQGWLETSLETPPPDLVDWIGIYGYIRLRLKTWKLPVKLSPEEMEHWRESGYYVTLDDFYEAAGSVAAGIAYTANINPQLTAQILQQQLDDKLAELERLANLPIEEYTPKFMEWQIRKELTEEGFTGAKFEEYLSEELMEDDHMLEMRRFEKPFEFRQQLESFEWGMEVLRPVVLSEYNEEVGLPSRELFDALMQIDLNALLARLADIDVQLRKIWRNLAKYDCFELNDSHEPKRFWWRHWEKQPKRAAHRSK
jgi:hypothetical protein